MKIKLRVKSTWQGQVGVHQKYVKAAIVNGADLEIVLKNSDERMVILKQDVRGKIKGVSPESFKDRFNGGIYKLVYFDWVPEKNPQQRLL